MTIKSNLHKKKANTIFVGTLEISTFSILTITNTYFKHKIKYLKTSQDNNSKKSFQKFYNYS